jgi:hypothetical protein
MNAKKLYKTDVVSLVSFLNTHMFKGTVLMSPNVGICNSSCFFFVFFSYNTCIHIYIRIKFIYSCMFIALRSVEGLPKLRGRAEILTRACRTASRTQLT